MELEFSFNEEKNVIMKDYCYILLSYYQLSVELKSWILALLRVIFVSVMT